jgi:hypothetical protein
MTPLERAARALEKQLFKRITAIERPVNGARYPITISGPMDMQEAVRAVLTAIREPSDVMLDRAYNHMEANGCDPRFAWEAMIDAMLEAG